MSPEQKKKKNFSNHDNVNDDGKVTCVTSSEAKCLSSVVFPALSNPSNRIRTSFSGADLNFLSNDNKPCQMGKPKTKKKKNIQYLSTLW